jgi:hypothetical protein
MSGGAWWKFCLRQETHMRTHLSIERLFPSYGSIKIGPQATEILSAVKGLSDIRVDAQRIDGAWISCLSNGPPRFAEIDSLLLANRLHRLQVNGSSGDRGERNT